MAFLYIIAGRRNCTKKFSPPSNPKKKKRSHNKYEGAQKLSLQRLRTNSHKTARPTLEFASPIILG
jgi:hypothetical protein